MTGEDQRAAQYARLVQEQQTLLTTRQGRARDLVNIAMLPLQTMNDNTMNEVKETGEQCLIFWLQDREFAIRAGSVQSVERLTPITPVPNSISWIKGVMNLRGSIVSVVDLREFLHLEPAKLTTRTRLLALQQHEMVISFIVDAVQEMLAISPESIVSGKAGQAAVPQWMLPYASGSIFLQERTIVLLDAERLLFSDKIQRF